MLLTMESVPSAVLNRRVSTDDGSLSRKDSFIDLWAAVAESSNRRDRCNNDHVQDKVNSQSSKGRNAYPSNEIPGESRRGSLSPRSHSRSPSSVRSKNEQQQRKGVVPHDDRTIINSEQPTPLNVYGSSSPRTRETPHRRPATDDASHLGEKHKNASTSHVQHRKMSMVDDDCYRNDHTSNVQHRRISLVDDNWYRNGHASNVHDRRMSMVDDDSYRKHSRRGRHGGSRRGSIGMHDVDWLKEVARLVPQNPSYVGEHRNVSISRVQQRRMSTSMVEDDCYRRGLDSRRERHGGLQRGISSMTDVDRLREASDIVTREDRTHQYEACHEDQVREKIKAVIDRQKEKKQQGYTGICD